MPETRLEFNDEQGRRVIRIDKDLFTIGRRAENDLQLSGKEVSREHAEITTEGDRYVLRDRDRSLCIRSAGTLVQTVQCASERSDEENSNEDIATHFDSGSHRPLFLRHPDGPGAGRT